MRRVGIREAKARLSELVRDAVREQEPVLITLRGRAVAELMPIRRASEDSLESGVAQLQRAGEMGPVDFDRRPLPEPMELVRSRLQEWLQEDRETARP